MHHRLPTDVQVAGQVTSEDCSPCRLRQQSHMASGNKRIGRDTKVLMKRASKCTVRLKTAIERKIYKWYLR